MDTIFPADMVSFGTWPRSKKMDNSKSSKIYSIEDFPNALNLNGSEKDEVDGNTNLKQTQYKTSISFKEQSLNAKMVEKNQEQMGSNNRDSKGLFPHIKTSAIAQYKLNAASPVSSNNNSSALSSKQPSLSTLSLGTSHNTTSPESFQSTISASTNVNSPTHLTKSEFSSTNQGCFVFRGSSAESSYQNNKVDQSRRKSASLLRRKSKRSKDRYKPKSVRWGSETVTTIVDDQSYHSYRSCLLNLRTPKEKSNSATIQAVSFMCDLDSDVSSTLIDVAMNLFWIKYNRHPSASELYANVCDFNFDEKCIVLEFIKECETEKGMSAVRSYLPEAEIDPITEEGMKHISI